MKNIITVLSSARLAMALLVIILACCLSGVTLWRGAEAGRMVFATLWFNGLLVLLVINVACCFFGRIWGRTVTVVSFGMILFHLSFVTMFLGVVYNSLFYFRGSLRLTEGETLVSGDRQSYDTCEQGKFFSFARLKGETTLIKMHVGYKVAGDDKRVAYEVAVGEQNNKKQGLIYVTHKLSHQGFDYFNDKEGYSLLLVLADHQGKELYGAHVPLQSIPVGSTGRYRYVTGHRERDTVVADFGPFPAPPEKPLVALQAAFEPSPLGERSGTVTFMAHPLDGAGNPVETTTLARGQIAIGQPFSLGNSVVIPREMRYWVGMVVRYEPGKPIVLVSLWVGLAGMIITTIGRIVRKTNQDAAQLAGL